MDEKTGLGYWAQRVLAELANVNRNFDPDPVHDLRVAIRRCRSMADALLAVDPDPGWKQQKKLAKALFSRLGELRDVQVMEEWVAHLGEPGDPVRNVLLRLLASREAQLKNDAQNAVFTFDQKYWQSLCQRLSPRTRAIPVEGMVFQHMAVERWQRAHELHRQALRNRTQIALHRLRIGLKKFRYTLENFLPQRHAKWGSDLRNLQDLLGDIHDMDVLAGILRTCTGLQQEERELWIKRIHQQQKERLEKYREKMLGRNSLWRTWREDLPAGPRLQEAAFARLRTWGAFLDPDIKHSKHVTQLALQLYDGLTRDDILPSSQKQRRILETAALLHDVGIAKGNRAHHKQSYRLIRKMTVPFGWTPLELLAAGAVARYHRGALPNRGHKCLRQLPAAVRPFVIRLAGVLRLANAFDLSHDGKVRCLQVERNNGTVVIHPEGYSPTGPTAERIAAARYLLEASCQIAVVVRASNRSAVLESS
jgi:exopolyphosphatase/guanosine-5'-triphosphate,3'-diphosphate pyrophosphatase